MKSIRFNSIFMLSSTMIRLHETFSFLPKVSSKGFAWVVIDDKVSSCDLNALYEDVKKMRKAKIMDHIS